MGRPYLIFIIVLFLSTSCDNNKKPRRYSLAKESSDNTILDKIPVKGKINFTWHAPNNWIEKKNSSLRLASYKIPYQDDLADLSITKFDGDAGGVLANVNRWRRQLGLQSQTLQQINANSISGSSMVGSFSVYKIINDNNIDEAFLCTILPYDDSTIFIKLKSSLTAINSLEKDFFEFCSTFRPIQ